jgi:hypothetical protein
VTEDHAACGPTRLVSAELALGVLEGGERGDALAHLAGCAACRAEVRHLAEAVDGVVDLAPEAEPPVGFESAVIARIADERAGRATKEAPGRRRRWFVAAAAALLLVLGIGVTLVVAREGRGASSVATARMEAPDGATVGEVWRTGEPDAVVFVSVPAWAGIDTVGPDAPRYALRLDLAGGDTVEVGDFTLGDGVSSWAMPTELDGEDIRAVSVVDDTGRVWCTGRFT